MKKKISAIVFSEGTNVYSESKSVSRNNINYANGWILARCGSVSKKSFNKEAGR